MTAVANKPRLSRLGRFSAVGLLCGLLLAAPVFSQEEWRFQGVERVVAIADVHGAYDAFQRILERAGLVDDALDWTGGRTHLVIVGDVVDRGAGSRRALDLIRKLEAQAPAAGGRVHMVLGNHEIMNMTGDLRYVAPGEYAAFAGEELTDVREAEFERFAEGLDGSRDIVAARQQFETRFPPGYFAHRQAFGSEGQYGQWLLEKPVLLVIDDFAFVHAGLAEALLGNVGSVNSRFRQDLRVFLSARERLVAASAISRTVDLYDLPAHAADWLAGQEQSNTARSGALRAAARQVQDLESLSFLQPDGPVWYRGNVSCNRLVERDRLAAALGSVGAARLVVGHTPTRGNLVLSRMDESLLRIDTGMLNEYYGGRASALVVEQGSLSVFYEDETTRSVPLPQPRRVGARPGALSAEELEELLVRAEVERIEPFDSTASLVSLIDGDFRVAALFTAAESDRVNAAVAAYRLDRVIGLDMVPVTVARELDGMMGALQYWPPGAINETERSAAGLGGAAWCPLVNQIEDMYLFDGLIYNRARTPQRIRYSTEDFQLLLVGHNQSFAPAGDRPPHLAGLPVVLTQAWRVALESLDQRNLGDALGDVLDRRRIRALLSRRDHLLELAQ